METKEKTQLTVGIFVLLVLTGGISYFVAQGDTAYHCEDTNLVGICWKLSNVNSQGLQTRCYYDESSSTRYKICRSGWGDFTEEISGSEPIPGPIGIDFSLEMEKLDALRILGIGRFETTNQSCKTWNYSESTNCLEWDVIRSQGSCISWNNQSNNTCLRYEISETRGVCLQSKTILQKEECLEIDNSVLSLSEPVISSCRKINEVECKAQIYQENGINKELVVSYILNGIPLSQLEIEGRLEDEADKLLDEIARVQMQRILLREKTDLSRPITLSIIDA